MYFSGWESNDTPESRTQKKQGLSLSRMPFRQSSIVAPMRIELILPKKSRLKLDASASSAIGPKVREWELHPHDYWL